MRVAIHAGEVHHDSNGWYGEDLDITFRLLNSRVVKRKLKQTTAPLVLVMSQDFYRSVIRHGYNGIDYRAFEPTIAQSSTVNTGFSQDQEEIGQDREELGFVGVM